MKFCSTQTRPRGIVELDVLCMLNDGTNGIYAHRIEEQCVVLAAIKPTLSHRVRDTSTTVFPKG